MFALLKKLYHSATWNKQLANFIRLANVVFILPLVIHRVSAEELRFWLVLAGLSQLSLVFEAGFMQNLANAFSFASSGGTRKSILEVHKRSDQREKSLSEGKSANVSLVSEIWTVNRRVFLVTGLLFAVCYGLIVFFTLGGLCKTLPNPSAGYRAIILASLFQPFSFLAKRSCALLVGCQRQAQVERVGMFAGVSTLILLSLSALFFPSLEALVGAPLIVGAVAALYFTLLVKKRRRELGVTSSEPFSKELFMVVWGRAWRTLVAAALGILVGQLPVLLIAVYVSAGEGAGLAIILRVLRFCYETGVSVFWVSIPVLCRYKVQGELGAFDHLASRRMLASLGLYCLGGVLFALVGEQLLALLKREPIPLDGNIYGILFAAFGLHLMATVTVRIYQTNNQIVIHLMTIAGLIGFILMGAGAWSSGAFALLVPFSMLGAQLGMAGYSYFMLLKKEGFSPARYLYGQVSLVFCSVALAWFFM